MSLFLHARRRAPLALVTAVLGLAACSGRPAPVTAPTPASVAVVASPPVPAAPPPTAPAAAPRPQPVFGAYASRVVVVFPLQRYAVGDSGWIAAAGAAGRLRAALADSVLTAVLRDRGLESLWSLPPNTSRVAQREVMNRTDPRALSIVGLAPGRRPNDVELREPLGSQLRAIIALVPEARMVLLPIEARVAITAGGAMQATLRLALIDGRLARVVSFPDVTGAPAADERAALQSAAARFSDMVVVP